MIGAAFATLVASLALATATAEGASGCLAELRSYRGSPPASVGALELDRPQGGALLYLPVRHTDAPADPQLQRLEREWRRFRPSVVFYEGHRDAVGPDRSESVRRFGEAGWVQYFAREQGIPARRLEPSPSAEVGHVRGSFSDHEVQLTYLLLEVHLRSEEGARPSRAKSWSTSSSPAGRIRLFPG